MRGNVSFFCQLKETRLERNVDERTTGGGIYFLAVYQCIFYFSTSSILLIGKTSSTGGQLILRLYQTTDIKFQFFLSLFFTKVLNMGAYQNPNPAESCQTGKGRLLSSRICRISPKVASGSTSFAPIFSSRSPFQILAVASEL